MEKTLYIRPEIRWVELDSYALLEDGFSETPSSETPEVNDTELDSNRGYFESDEYNTPKVNVWD
ncbi:MAG: hypothetical protein IKX36_00600 [Prevotella sp.]|nr:hypothetical protein [Prevotella sp.]